MTPFRTAFASTAIPIAAVSILSLAGTVSDGPFYHWLVLGYGFGWWLAAVVAAVGFAVAGKRQVASGILAGIGVGFLSLVVSCFSQVGGPLL